MKPSTCCLKYWSISSNCLLRAAKDEVRIVAGSLIILSYLVYHPFFLTYRGQLAYSSQTILL